MQKPMTQSLWRAPEPLVLASASAGRQHVLRAAAIPFEAVPAGIDERAIEAGVASRDADDVALTLARAKAASVAADAPRRYVLGADQVASCGDRLFGKPATMAAAADLLRFLSGRRHRLHSAIVLLRDGVPLLETVVHAEMVMRPLGESFIAGYLEIIGERALASAGAYQVEGVGAHLFSAVIGDHWTIMGLPLIPLLECLRAEGALDA